MAEQPILDTLQKASAGLVFVSESDAPLEPFVWEGAGDMSAERLLKLAGAAPKTPIEETSLDSFFRVVPKEDRAKFQKLTKVLQQQLSGIKVYKLGEGAEKSVYIVGKTQASGWAGLKTTVVET